MHSNPRPKGWGNSSTAGAIDIGGALIDLVIGTRLKPGDLYALQSPP